MQENERSDGTIILSCTCTHAYQDIKYGKGKRVFNLKKKNGTARCTVCKWVKE